MPTWDYDWYRFLQTLSPDQFWTVRKLLQDENRTKAEMQDTTDKCLLIEGKVAWGE